MVRAQWRTKVRAAIQASDEVGTTLAERFGVTPQTIYKWRKRDAANARRFLRDLERACPIRIRTILTDNSKEITDRLFGLLKRAASGQPEFDTLCAALEIDHRLTPRKSPQNNGMVERFNGRIEEVLQSHHFRSGEELEATDLRRRRGKRLARSVTDFFIGLEILDAK